MAQVVTFDPINLRIIENSVGGDNVLDLDEIYSEWKVWLKQGDNAKYAPAFRFVGGEPTTSTSALGTTYFLRNGWRIRPAELNHKLTVEGNIFTEPEGFSVFVPTLGAFNVNTETSVSNLTEVQIIDEGRHQTHMSVAYEPGATELRVRVWLARSGVVITTPTSCKLTWFKMDHTTWFVKNETSHTNGVFDFTHDQPMDASGAYYADVEVVDAEGPIVTRWAVPSAGV